MIKVYAPSIDYIKNIILLGLYFTIQLSYSQELQTIGNKGVKDGFGVLENPGNGVYRGNFVNSLYEGYGEYYFDNGSVYKGNFKNGLYEGEGTIYYSDGGIRVANFKVGKEISVTSNIYANEKLGGCVSGDCQNGFGKYVFTNGEYEGSFLYGKQSGHGKLTLPNGDNYEGQFSNGYKNGFGVLNQANGKKYEGFYQNNEKSGLGTFYFLDGSKYIGNWTNGKMNGKGEFYYSNGSYYVGEFIDGNRSGYGKIVFADRQIQEGIFENDIYKGVKQSNTITQNTSVNPPTVEKNQVSGIKTQVDPRYTTNIKTVVIGTQTWTTENLNVSTFRNGDPIPEVKTNEEWINAWKNGSPAWCYYNNDPKNGEKYGKLYNWYAVNDTRGLAPSGYHVPFENEWNTLQDYLGGESIAGEKMKCKPDIQIEYIYKDVGGYYETKWIPCSGCDWMTSKQFDNNGCAKCRNQRGKSVKTGKYIPKSKVKEEIKTNLGWDGTNEYGFSALPSGYRNVEGIYVGDDLAVWWSSTEYDKIDSTYFFISHENLHKNRHDKNGFFSVRLIKD